MNNNRENALCLVQRHTSILCPGVESGLPGLHPLSLSLIQTVDVLEQSCTSNTVQHTNTTHQVHLVCLAG